MSVADSILLLKAKSFVGINNNILKTKTKFPMVDITLKVTSSE